MFGAHPTLAGYAAANSITLCLPEGPRALCAWDQQRDRDREREEGREIKRKKDRGRDIQEEWEENEGGREGGKEKKKNERQGERERWRKWCAAGSSKLTPVSCSSLSARMPGAPRGLVTE